MTGVALDPEKPTTPLSRDLIALTKPRIISLLLVTTVAPMYAAGSPTLLTVLLVSIGGYLMAGGANAVNMYLDRDIDDVMARTRLRPIPSGRMSPIQVLAFGVACATFATWMLAHFVNVLTAGLALAGFYFYVFIYTRWLKRSSPQNIVIGGAAGAFPPLVGWAAVTGTLDVTVTSGVGVLSTIVVNAQDLTIQLGQLTQATVSGRDALGGTAALVAILLDFLVFFVVEVLQRRVVQQRHLRRVGRDRRAWVADPCAHGRNAPVGRGRPPRHSPGRRAVAIRSLESPCAQSRGRPPAAAGRRVRSRGAAGPAC